MNAGFDHLGTFKNLSHSRYCCLSFFFVFIYFPGTSPQAVLTSTVISESCVLAVTKRNPKDYL